MTAQITRNDEEADNEAPRAADFGDAVGQALAQRALAVESAQSACPAPPPAQEMKPRRVRSGCAFRTAWNTRCTVSLPVAPAIAAPARDNTVSITMSTTPGKGVRSAGVQLMARSPRRWRRRACRSRRRNGDRRASRPSRAFELGRSAGGVGVLLAVEALHDPGRQPRKLGAVGIELGLLASTPSQPVTWISKSALCERPSSARSVHLRPLLRRQPVVGERQDVGAERVADQDRRRAAATRRR